MTSDLKRLQGWEWLKCPYVFRPEVESTASPASRQRSRGNTGFGAGKCTGGFCDFRRCALGRVPSFFRDWRPGILSCGAPAVACGWRTRLRCDLTLDWWCGKMATPPRFHANSCAAMRHDASPCVAMRIYATRCKIMRGDARSLSAASGGAIQGGKRLSRFEEEAEQHRGRFSRVLPPWNTANDSARIGCVELTGIHWNSSWVLLELKRIHSNLSESKPGDG